MISFFMPMIPPTVTKQEVRIGYSKKSEKAYFYDSPEIADAQQKLEANLAKHVPSEPIKNTPIPTGTRKPGRRCGSMSTP